MRRAAVLALLASVILSSCSPTTEETAEMFTRLEAEEMAKIMVAETAEAETKLILAIEQTQAVQPTSTEQATAAITSSPAATITITPTTKVTAGPTLTVTATRTPTPIASPTRTPAASDVPEAMGQISVGTGNLRSGPGTAYNVLAQLPLGTELILLERTNDSEWLRVSVMATQQEGWASLTILELDVDIEQLDEAEDIPPLPTLAPTQLSVPTATTAPVVSGSTQFGLGGQVIHGGLLALDKMQAMKMSWVKIQNYDLGGATLEGDIQNAHNNGLKILVSVKDNANHTRITAPDYQEQFVQYLERVATLGADAIEVWNEPNLDREWPADQMGGANYTELLKKAYPRIKAANPNTIVISAALSPTGAFSGGCGSIGTVYGCDDKPFLQEMVNAGALNYLDCVGMHYNEGLLAPTATSGDPRGNSGHYTRYFRGMLDTYGAILGGARSICLTEIGYLSGEEWGYLPSAFSWNPASAVNMSVAQHADYLGQSVTLARQMGNIRLMIIFNVDFAILKNMEDDPQAGYSLVRPNQSCPACSTIAAAMP